MKLTLLLLSCLLTLPANATIYIVAFDEATGAVGTAVSSSGPPWFKEKRWHVSEPGLGMVSAGGAGFCSKATPLEFLRLGLSARDIAYNIARQCDEKKPYYRLAIVTNKGDTFVHEGPEGCNEWNEECATIQGSGFGVTGGGLEEGVVQKTFDHFQGLGTSAPLECRLYSALKRAFDEGGETIDFKVSGITVHYPNQSKALRWQISGSELKLLGKLSEKMREDGVYCSEF